MRLVTAVGRGGIRGAGSLLRLLVAASLVTVLAVGCRGDEASGQEVPDTTGQPAPTGISDEVLLPGDQRPPDGARTVTTALRLPIARTASPAAPRSRAITTSRPASTATTAPTTPTTTPGSPGS